MVANNLVSHGPIASIILELFSTTKKTVYNNHTKWKLNGKVVKLFCLSNNQLNIYAGKVSIKPIGRNQTLGGGGNGLILER